MKNGESNKRAKKEEKSKLGGKKKHGEKGKKHITKDKRQKT